MSAVPAAAPPVACLESVRLFIVDDEAPARARLRTLLADIAAHDAAAGGWHIVGEADNAEQAIVAIRASAPDIVLMDVQMPGLSGVELAAQLSGGAPGSGPAIIFVTASDDHALAAFEVHALDYLVKPVRSQRLALAIARVLALRRAVVPGSAGLPDMENKKRHFSVQERGRVVLVPLADVVYLKAELKYVTLCTREREYLIEASLLSIEMEHGATFVRVHRNALVARSAIAGVERSSSAIARKGETGHDMWHVVLRGMLEQLPISRRQWAVIKALVS